MDEKTPDTGLLAADRVRSADSVPVPIILRLRLSCVKSVRRSVRDVHWDHTPCADRGLGHTARATEGALTVIHVVPTVHEELDAYEAVVYDLDGTLVRLVVDWNEVAREAASVFEAADATVHGIDLWGMIDIAAEYGLGDRVERVIADHERRGARRSERLSLADAVPSVDGPAGVCSLNCEDACRIALDTHDLASHVDTVVGRDTVGTRKPDPEPLLETLRRLEVDPADAVFVGDSPRDELTADRAGVAFRYVDGTQPDH